MSGNGTFTKCIFNTVICTLTRAQNVNIFLTPAAKPWYFSPLTQKLYTLLYEFLKNLRVAQLQEKKAFCKLE